MSVRLGERLTTEGLISNDQLRIALLEQKRNPQPLGQHLLHLGFVKENTLREHLAKQMGYTPVRWEGEQPDPDLLKMIKAPQARRHRILPWQLDSSQHAITVVTPYPDNPLAIHHLQSNLPPGMGIKVLFACEDEVDRAIAHYYPASNDPTLVASSQEPPSRRKTDADHSAIDSINQIIQDAVRQRASDIHFEPGPHSLTLRFRIDGLLRVTREFHHETWRSLLIRLKVLSGMDIAEQRLPQDGRFTHQIHGEAIDIRSASFPTPDGEHMVLRLLQRQRALMPLSQLGLSSQQIICLQQMLQRPDGLVLVTGPTGSGKTTTLYALLQALQHESLSLVTLEDPIEYRLPGIRQCAVNEDIGLSFAAGVKSLLRQDPDVILIGEIRDPDTAKMAFQAAMTGHRVLSTLHTRSALDALARLREFGLPERTLAPHLSGLIGQRLVRKRCEHCPPKPTNCPQCAGTGYFGQQILMEALQLTPALQEAIEAEQPLGQLRKLADREGFISLEKAAQQLVSENLCDPAEIERVLG